MSADQWIKAYRNEHGYWVAKVFHGNYSGLQSWRRHRKEAIREVWKTLNIYWDKYKSGV